MDKKLRIFMIIVCLISINTFAGCTQKAVGTDLSKLTVAVSIVPQETFVKAVAGDLVDIVTMIPPGNSPENYAPTPKKMEQFSEAAVYFSIGVPAEAANILPKAKQLNKDLHIVHLADEVGKLYPHRYFGQAEEQQQDEHSENEHDEEGHTHEGRDPHIWISPKRVKVMIDIIAEELSAIDVQNKENYQKNAAAYIEKLDTLDEHIRTALAGLDNKTFIVYHPSFGYFAEDYELEMIALEKEGKEATAKEMQIVIDKAKKENIKVIFYQAEIDSRQTKAFAREINGRAEKVDPLAANYIENMEKISKTFKSVLE